MADKFEQAVRLIERKFFELNRSSGVNEFFIGQIARNEQRGPGDVVFVSDGGTFSPNPHHGAGFDDGANTMTSGMLVVDSKRFELITWGCDAEEAESLRNAVLRAADQSVGLRNFRVTEYVDITEEAEKHGHNWAGRAIITSGELDLVIPKETVPFVLTSPETTSGDYE